MKLKEFRVKNNLRQEDVAKIINKTSVAYSYYESGRNEPDLNSLIILADFYHTTVDNLIEHKVPYLLDKSSLTQEQREIVELVPQMNYEECKLMLAYLEGVRKGIEKRNSNFNSLKKGNI